MQNLFPGHPQMILRGIWNIQFFFGVFWVVLAHKKCKFWSLVWRHLGQTIFSNLVIFDPTNILILVMGDTHMMFGGIWNIFLQMMAFFTPQIGIFDSQNMQILYILVKTAK